MAWHQSIVRLRARARGFHLVTDELVAQVPQLKILRVGLAHLFIQHTSASLTINENADPTVRADFERWTREVVPDGAALAELSVRKAIFMASSTARRSCSPGL